jgi:hypothetical protein
LENQLGKNRNFAKLISQWGNIHAPIRVGIGVAKPGERVEKNSREGFLIKVIKRRNDINIILFLSRFQW